jgi:hypothetical protein
MAKNHKEKRKKRESWKEKKRRETKKKQERTSTGIYNRHGQHA